MSAFAGEQPPLEKVFIEAILSVPDRAFSALSTLSFLELFSAVLADTVSKLESMIIGRHAKITLEDLPRRRPFAPNDSSIHYSTVNNAVTERGIH